MMNDDLPAPLDNGKSFAARIFIAVVGGAIPVVGGAMESLVNDVIRLHLSPMESSRIERVMQLASELIDQKAQQGYEPRVEGFEGTTPGNRPLAVEFAEGSFLKVKSEYEERKIPFYSAFICSYVYNSALDAASAGTVLSLLSDLSYRQCCIVALASRQTVRSSLHDDVRLRVYRDLPSRIEDTAFWGNTITQELAKLVAVNLLDVSHGLSEVPSMYTLTGFGKLFVSALNLNSIGEGELTQLHSRLSAER